MIAKADELKPLKKRLEKLESLLKSAKDEAAEAQRRVAQVKGDIDSVQKQIHAIEARNTEIRVTDHALLRYCERVLGVDLEAARQAILTDKVRGYIETLGNGKFPVPGANFAVRVVDRTVVTVVND